MARLIILALVGAFLGIILLNVLRATVGEGPVAIIWIALLITVIVVVVRNLGTNRKVPDASVETRNAALAFTPDPAKAALYILRTQFVGKAVGVNVLIDGREVAQIKSPRFTRILLSPGTHRISAYTGTNKKPAEGEGVVIEAKAGEQIVMMCEVVPQMVGANIAFKPLVLDHVRATIAKTRMVQPDVAEV